jgi:molybdate transport system ATP-binding protein
VILDASFTLSLGSLAMDIEVGVGDEIVGVLGPNGAGKTTLLRAVGGLVAVDAGRIGVDEAVLDDPSARRFVPPERRPVGMVFQDYLLFPFLSVRENVAYGLRARGVARRTARRRADEWLERVKLAAMADARPAELSGGQAQRVALARALATEPRVLLLDEPLAALDAGARIELRHELREQLAAYPGARLLVTHDPVDAAALCDRLVILEGGAVVQEGTMSAIAQHPRSRYVADLVGLNFYRGHARGGVVAVGGTAEVVIADTGISGDVFLTVRPQSVTLQHASLPVSARNQWTGKVLSVERLGERVRVRVGAGLDVVAEVTPQALESLDLAVGRPVVAAVKASEVGVYEA